MSDVDTSAETVERLAQLCEYANRPITAATLRALVAERDSLKLTLSNLLSVTPAFPAPARQIVGMEDRYNKAIKEAREVLGL